jgi:hypothetical protein
MARSTKQKGRLLENWVADQIVAKGIDPKARADGASGAGNREKADISTSMTVLGQNAGIECKNQSHLNIQEWFRQTKKLEKLQMEPILCFHIENEPWEETKVVIYLNTFLDIVKLSNSEKVYEEVTPEDTREKKWAIQNAISALKKLEKFYEI